MTLTEYLNQESAVAQPSGSVVLKRGEYETMFLTERDPRTDKKFNQLYVTFEILERQYTYKVTTPLLILNDFKRNKPSVFSIQSIDFKEIEQEHQNNIIREIANYL